jgi:integrase/recombinase XerD
MNPIIIDEAFREFLRTIDCNSASLATYSRVLRIYARFLSIKKLKYNQIRLHEILEFKRGLVQKGLQPNSINLYVSIIRRFYGFLNDNGICSTKVTGLKKENVTHGYKRLPLTVEQVQTLFTKINVETEIGQRDFTLISLMVNTGLRRSEVASIDTQDLFKRGSIVGVYIKRKGHTTKDQHKVLSLDVFELLNKQAGERKNEPLFLTMVPGMERRRLSACQIANVVKRYFNEIGLTDKLYSTHSLRHTTAVTMYQQGKELHEIMQYLGHSSIKTTQLYTQMIREVQSWSDNAANMLNDIFKKRDKNSGDNS